MHLEYFVGFLFVCLSVCFVLDCHVDLDNNIQRRELVHFIGYSVM